MLEETFLNLYGCELRDLAYFINKNVRFLHLKIFHLKLIIDDKKIVYFE